MNIKEKAKQFAIKAHQNQIRKSNGKPMIYHPLAVAEILESFNYSDEIIAAGYLHDTIEDTTTTIEDIKKSFGNEVAKLVLNASESDKSLSWEERKKETIEKVKNSPIEDIVVILADKIHNVDDFIIELKKQGLELFNNFKRKQEKQIWYFEGIYNAIDSNNKKLPIAQRLKKAIEDFRNEIEYQKELEDVLFKDDRELLKQLRSLHILKYQVLEEGYTKPFIVEILGTPRTGKTTTINNVFDFLKKGGFKVKYFEELVTSDFYNTIKDLPLLERNLAIVDEIINQLESVINSKDNIDIAFFDRCVHDRLIWFRRMFNNKEITKEEYEKIIKKYKEPAKLVSSLLCFTASPEVSLKRDYLSSLALEKRSFLNTENIKTYNTALQELINDKIISNYHIIDTDNKTLDQTAIETAQLILTEIKK